MDIKYNREIDENLSMGEYALLYYDDIADEKILNKMILSTILRLHKKRYVELDKIKNDELIVKIKNGTEKLRVSETFIYECLKVIDTNGDGILTLSEFNAVQNNVFAKHKNNIKELIIQEAMADELIDTDKYKKKRRYFFRAFEILVIVILTLFIGVGSAFRATVIIALIFLFNFMHTGNMSGIINYSKDKMTTLKNELAKDELMKYSSKEEIKGIIIEFVLCMSIYYAHIYWLNEIFSVVLFIIEALVAIIIAIIEFVKFKKADVFTEKAIEKKEKLKGLENYLRDYSLIENRQAIEVHLWEDYLALSVLLGINANITEEIKLNLSENKEKNGMQFDYYANKYFYINEKGEKVFKEYMD